MKTYLEGPDDFTGVVISVIKNGQLTAVDMDLDEVLNAYTKRTFHEFSEQYLEPAFMQLFDSEQQEQQGGDNGTDATSANANS